MLNCSAVRANRFRNGQRIVGHQHDELVDRAAVEALHEAELQQVGMVALFSLHHAVFVAVRLAPNRCENRPEIRQQGRTIPQISAVQLPIIGVRRGSREPRG